MSTRDLASPSLTLPSPAPDRLTTRGPASTKEAERAQLGELAAQFESMLLLEMIKQMRKSLLDEQAEGEGLGNETYSSTIDGELALHLARAGGLGLTPMLVDAWDRRQGEASATAPPVRSTTASTAVMPSASVAPSSRVSEYRRHTDTTESGASVETADLRLEMPGRVSSAYGWRTDPFGGHGRFHAGIDLAARYGTEVPAAAAGTVVAAEEQGGYGLSVVIRHPNGFESRYAHLASLEVKAGDQVGQGQRIGRVGSTGRSTGPHLHFEVTHAGRRIDPERFVRNLTSDIKGQ